MIPICAQNKFEKHNRHKSGLCGVTRNLPPLPALRVFEAAARHRSFTSAAGELGMTQAAVSYQIKVLEERVGTSLFERYPRGVGLTEVGRKLFHHVAAALDILADAYDNAQGTGSTKLCISVIPTFATNFLAARIGMFQALHTGMAVRFEISEALTDFAQGDFDAAVRGGSGEWDGLRSDLLIPTRFTPMMSPKLVAEFGPVQRPEDLLAMPILSGGDPWWQRWLSAFGQSDIETTTRRSHTFGPQVTEAAAAVAGQGVAMLTPAFFQNELQSGVLIQPFQHLGDDGSGYWLVYPEARRNVLKIKHLRSWLLKETAEFRV